MATEIGAVRSDVDYEVAIAEFEQVWSARSGAPDGDRLHVLATLIAAYEDRRFPFATPERSKLRDYEKDNID